MFEDTAQKAVAQVLPYEPDVWLPEASDIIPGSDIFDELTPAEPFWRQRQPEPYDQTVIKSAIIIAWCKKKIGTAEAFEAMRAYDLLDDQIMWMIAQQHNCARIIEGNEDA